MFRFDHIVHYISEKEMPNPVSLKREISSIWIAVKEIGEVTEKWSQLLENKVVSFTDWELGLDGLEFDLEKTKLRFVSNEVLRNSSNFKLEHKCERPFLVEFSNGVNMVKLNGGYYRI